MKRTSSRTPARPRTTRAALLGALAGAVGTVLFLSVFEPRMPELDLALSEVVILLLGVVPVVGLVLAVHEAGHLLGGWSAGFRAVLWIVGPLSLERTGKGWKARFNRSVALWGGFAASVPEDGRNLRRRMLLFGAGSVLAGLATLVPGRTAGLLTDGARIRRLLRPSEEAEQEAALLALTGSSLSGRRPREWDEALIERALRSEADDPMGAGARQLAHLYALDRGEVERAARHLDEVLAEWDGLSQLTRAGLGV